MKVFFFIFIISLAIGSAIHFIGEDGLSQIFFRHSCCGRSCGRSGRTDSKLCRFRGDYSALFRRHYRSGTDDERSFGQCGNGSFGIVQKNRHRHENLIIAGLLYGVSVAWGIVIEVLGNYPQGGFLWRNRVINKRQSQNPVFFLRRRRQTGQCQRY